MRGIIYARQSKKEQRENSYSIPSQIDEMTQYATSNEIELPYEPIVDAGKSGQKIQREGLEKCLKLIDSDPQINCFLVIDVDRIGRHEVDPLFFMWILNYRNVKIISKLRKYDIKEDPADVILSAVDCYKGYREGRDIGERTQRGKKARFKDGLWVQSFIPEGYDSIIKWFDDNKTRKRWLTRKQSTEPIIQETVIQEIFTTYHKKPIFRDAISTMGVKYEQTFNKKLTENSLKRILQDPVYIGKPKYGELSRCEPELVIIDETLFNEVQQKISKNRSNHTTEERKQNVFDIVSKNFGLGFASRTFPEFVPRCICGGYMVVHDGSITKGVWVSRYVCSNHNCNKSKTLPTGVQIDNYKNLNLLSCPFCRETEYFTYCRVPNSDEYIYSCRKCGGSFKSTVNPNRYLRKIATKKDQVPTVNPVQQEGTSKKQPYNLSLDTFT